MKKIKIANYGVNMSAQYQKVEIYQREERLEMWVGKKPEKNNERGNLPGFIKDMLEISEEARQKFRENAVQQVYHLEEIPAEEIEDPEWQKMFVLKALIEALTGKKFDFTIPKLHSSKGAKPSPNNSLTTLAPSQGWGIEYDLRESYYQKERMSFTAGGTIKTTDGREIDFSVQLNMTREFASQHQISFRAGDAVTIDPLVVHFDSTGSAPAPSLTEQKYQFDLDADGILDSISFAGPGSGFLAYDRNNDGLINDGTELFGPQTGNGFSELAQYDEDGNGWIDENDAIFHQLVIWTKDENGNDQLFTLGQKGIGAIYLGHLDTPFTLTGNQQQLGEIAKTGIFLKENGQAGLIQHIDLVV